MQQIATQGGRAFTQLISASGSNLRFKGRCLHRFASVTPYEITPTWNCWYVGASNGAGTPAMPNAVPMTSVAVALYDLDAITPVGSVAVVTKNGSASFTIPTGIDAFEADALTPASFGLSAWPARYFLEPRVMYDLTAGQSAPGLGGSNRPGQQQMWLGTVAQLPNDVVGTGPMSSSGGTFIGGFMPFFNGRFRQRVKSGLIVGDSFAARDNDFFPFIASDANLPPGGGGPFTRAFVLADMPFFNAGVSGRTTAGTNLSTKLVALARYIPGGVVTTILGANDIAFTKPGGAAGEPVTASYIVDQNKTLWASLRGYGVGKIVSATIAPRLADNNYKVTDLSQMTPYVTQATTAGGAPSNGYGFGAGETGEQWNAALLALAGAADGPDAVFDLNSYCRDPTTTWKWKVHPFSTTLAASVAIAATSISLTDAPAQFMTPVLEPGVSGVDGATQLCALSIGGAGPYAVTVNQLDTYSNTSVFGAPTKAHASGVAVRGTYSFDGTHPTTEQARALATPLASAMAA